MTDNTSEIDIDGAKIREYIKQYRETDDREEQREIENQVLRETVWQSSPDTAEDTLTLNEAQVELIDQVVPDDATEARQILRSHHVEKL